jgi:hypothetical protein
LLGASFQVLEPAPEEALIAGASARARLQARIANAKETTTMWDRIFARRYRPAWTAAIILVALGASFAFPPVRALAGRFLSLFRVQQVTVLPIDAERVKSQLGQLGSSSQREKMMTDTVKVEPLGQREEVASAAAATVKVGVQVRTPAALTGAPKWIVQPASRVTFDMDLARIRAILTEIGRGDIALPEEVDGSAITVNIPASAVALYGECGAVAEGQDPDQHDRSTFRRKDCTVLVQLLSPTVAAPAGFDPNGVAEALLQVLGMSAEEAREFSQTVNWATTLVVPIPRNASSAEVVDVDGVKGSLIRYLVQGQSERYLLIWIKDEVVHVLSGLGDTPKAVAIANSLR